MPGTVLSTGARKVNEVECPPAWSSYLMRGTDIKQIHKHTRTHARVHVYTLVYVVVNSMVKVLGLEDL